MSWPLDDPRWTAHLLGELPPTEQEAAERQLASDPELRHHVEAMRDTVALLHATLRTEDAERTLDPLRREAVRRAEREHRETRPFRVWGPAVAALLALGFGIVHLLDPAPTSFQPETDSVSSRETEPRPSSETESTPTDGSASPDLNQPKPGSFRTEKDEITRQAFTSDEVPSTSRSEPKKERSGNRLRRNLAEKADRLEEEAAPDAPEGAELEQALGFDDANRASSAPAPEESEHPNVTTLSLIHI